jgi:hypothetical protein
MDHGTRGGKAPAVQISTVSVLRACLSRHRAHGDPQRSTKPTKRG